jgi:hypothetical protein
MIANTVCGPHTFRTMAHAPGWKSPKLKECQLDDEPSTQSQWLVVRMVRKIVRLMIMMQCNIEIYR